MNLNELAKEIAKREGKTIQVNIAQIKEIIKCLCEILDEQDGIFPKKKKKGKKIK